MSDSTNDPANQPGGDPASGAPVGGQPVDDRWVDDLGRRAGAAIRRPAPSDGIAGVANRRRSVERRTRMMVGGGTCAVILLIGGGAVALRNSGEQDATNTPVDEPPQAVSTTVVRVPEVTIPPAPVPTADPTTTATPTTTVAPTTTLALLSAETQWSLDYTGGTAGPASGEPVRIGWRDSGDPTTQLGIDAAVRLLNEELGGIGGRPIEMVGCQSGDTEAECAAKFAADPGILAVVAGESPSTEFYNGVGSSKPMLMTFSGDQSLAVPEMDPEAVPGYLYNGDGALNVMLPMTFAIERLPERPRSVLFVGVFASGLRDGFRAAWPDVDIRTVESLINDDMGDGSVEQVAAALDNAGVAEVDAVVIVDISQEKCFNIADALNALGVSPTVVALENCADHSAIRERLAARDIAGDAPEGWYVVTSGWRSTDIDTGWPTLRSAIGATSNDALAESLAPGHFAAVMTLAKLINGLGGADFATVPALRRAIQSFEGPMLGQPGQLRCGEVRFVVQFLNSAYACATAFDVVRYTGGEWVEIATARQGGSVEIGVAP